MRLLRKGCKLRAPWTPQPGIAPAPARSRSKAPSICSHPLANREFLFPYASVVQVPQAEMLSQIGPSLVVTAITQNAAFRSALLESPLIDRLNLGPIRTTQVAWDQPHEGNLFEFLYRRRALELA
jgi:hypothetical protein